MSFFINFNGVSETLRCARRCDRVVAFFGKGYTVTKKKKGNNFFLERGTAARNLRISKLPEIVVFFYLLKR